MIYLLRIAKILLKLIYPVFKLVPTNKKKVTFLSRQTNEPSIDFLLLKEELERRDSKIKVVMLTKRIEKNPKELWQYAVIMVKSLYHIATSRVCILDTYWPAISLLEHKSDLTVIQVWHAMGKIKQSGYQNLAKAGGRSEALAHEMGMHKNYDLIIAGGKYWNPFYCASFGVEEHLLYNVGLPRVDYLIHNQDTIRARIFGRYPQLQGKPLVLYAPTWRKTGIDGWDELLKQLDADRFNLVVKGHPNQKLEGGIQIDEFSTLDVLAACDYVITDYSAIAVEAAAICRKTFYYLYDYETYLSKNGMNINLFEEMPNCVFTTAPKLVEALEGEYPMEELERYRKKFLPPTIGRSTELIADKIIGGLKHA